MVSKNLKKFLDESFNTNYYDLDKHIKSKELSKSKDLSDKIQTLLGSTYNVFDDLASKNYPNFDESALNYALENNYLGFNKTKFQDILAFSHTKESLKDIISTQFPNNDPDILIDLLSDETNNIQKITDRTFSEAVFSFKKDASVIYGKIGIKDMLLKEKKYMQDAKKHEFLRPITTSVDNLISGKIFDCLLTEDSKNFDDPKALHSYLNLRSEVFAKYCMNNSEEFANLFFDTSLIDVFNLAVHHTYMRKHINEPEYKLANLTNFKDSRIYEFDIQNANPEFKRKFKKLIPLYNSLENEIKNYMSEPNIICHGDFRKENIFPSITRKIGDFGLAYPGISEFDLGRFETPNIEKYVKAYVFFRNEVEKGAGNNFYISDDKIPEMIKKTSKISFTNSMRLAAFKSKQQEISGSKKYLNLAKFYFNKINSNIGTDNKYISLASSLR